MPEHPRRLILIDRRFQLQYLYIWLWVGVLMVLLGLGFYFLFAKDLLGDRLRDPAIVRLLSGMSGFLVLFSLLMGLLSVVLSHRVAGAAWRLHQILTRLVEGDVEQRIALRPNDYLQPIAGKLIELQEILRRGETSIATTVARIEETKLRLAREGKITEADKAAIDEIVHPLRVSFARRGEPAAPVSTPSSTPV
jgi:hypothetical protein